MKDIYEQALPLAVKIMTYARDSIVMNMRFLDVAISAIKPQPRKGLGTFACDGAAFYYDPVLLLKKYKEEPAFAVRLYLHVLFHLIFYHSFRYDKVDRENWSLSADMAVEAAVLELDFAAAAGRRDEEKQAVLRGIREEIGGLSAEKLYRYFKNFPVSDTEKERLRELFFADDHIYWEPKEEVEITLEQWQKLSRRVQADLKSFSKGKNKSETLEKSLSEAVKDRYRYSDLLKKFMVMNEDMQINEDEFDYIYYTYGLSRYGNMPLVEPLEYKDSKKIKEFVIAIDTSASCRGQLVQAFLQKTYAILSGEDSFFRKMNVHIIQCDHEVRQDTKITGKEDLDAFLR